MPTTAFASRPVRYLAGSGQRGPLLLHTRGANNAVTGAPTRTSSHTRHLIRLTLANGRAGADSFYEVTDRMPVSVTVAGRIGAAEDLTENHCAALAEER